MTHGNKKPFAAILDDGPIDWDFVAANMGLARFWAYRLQKKYPSEDPEDMVADGIFGVVRASQKYDPETGNTFGTYSAAWIRHFIDRGIAVRREMTKANGEIMHEVGSLNFHVGSDEGGLELGDLIPDPRAGTEDVVVNQTFYADLIASLTRRERAILFMPPDRVGAAFNLSPASVKTLRSVLIGRLRRKLAA